MAFGVNKLTGRPGPKRSSISAQRPRCRASSNRWAHGQWMKEPSSRSAARKAMTSRTGPSIFGSVNSQNRFSRRHREEVLL